MNRVRQPRPLVVRGLNVWMHGERKECRTGKICEHLNIFNLKDLILKKEREGGWGRRRGHQISPEGVPEDVLE